MEQRLDRAVAAVSRLSAAMDQYEDALEDIEALEKYYNSPTWRQDFVDDCAGRLPKDLKRGVLSEDAIWNLLETQQELEKRMMML